MTQFTLYANPNKQTRGAFPYLLDVQVGLLRELNTRVVVPVARPSGKPIDQLCPVVEAHGEKLVLFTQQLAGVPKSALGEPVADLSQHRAVIISALDFLFTGI